MRAYREHCRDKMVACVRLAREASRNSWQAEGRRLRAAYAQVSIEAMQDARDWREHITH
jgi:hypothetical protein